MRGGPQDLQRHPQWGIPNGSVVPAFVGSASNHLGYVTALTPVPMLFSEVGGGVSNGINAVRQWMSKIWSGKGKDIDTGGPYWLSPQNHANIVQGYQDGLAASKPASAFMDYGYGTRPQRPSSAIGDGNGVSRFSASLAGINPDEPAPAAWPPEANAPVRYLSSYRVRY